MLNRANKTERLSKCNFYRDKLWTQLPVFILLTVKVYVDFASSVIAEDRKKILGVMFHFPIKNKEYGLFLKHGGELVVWNPASFTQWALS